MRSSDSGFTLIEVLGAVAMLAILYTTLSTVAIRGLRSEGESQRMLEASMLADWELSEKRARPLRSESPRATKRTASR
jgi:prepilin-type N-terminal cleavage/methylation domain-containing protein